MPAVMESPQSHNPPYPPTRRMIAVIPVIPQKFEKPPQQSYSQAPAGAAGPGFEDRRGDSPDNVAAKESQSSKIETRAMPQKDEGEHSSIKIYIPLLMPIPKQATTIASKFMEAPPLLCLSLPIQDIARSRRTNLGTMKRMSLTKSRVLRPQHSHRLSPHPFIPIRHRRLMMLHLQLTLTIEDMGTFHILTSTLNQHHQAIQRRPR